MAKMATAKKMNLNMLIWFETWFVLRLMWKKIDDANGMITDWIGGTFYIDLSHEIRVQVDYSQCRSKY